jgi:hypothetical protein
VAVKGFGVLLTALGALFMSTTVSSSVLESVQDGTSIGGVYNLGLLQHQLMIFIVGLAVALSGVFIAFTGIVIEQRPENGNVTHESQILEEPREPSAPTLPSTRFTAEE